MNATDVIEHLKANRQRAFSQLQQLFALRLEQHFAERAKAPASSWATLAVAHANSVFDWLTANPEVAIEAAAQAYRIVGVSMDIERLENLEEAKRHAAK